MTVFVLGPGEGWVLHIRPVRVCAAVKPPFSAKYVIRSMRVLYEYTNVAVESSSLFNHFVEC